MPQRYPHGELVVVIDCADLDQSERFWAAALGYAAANPGSRHYRSLVPARGAGLEILLQQVGEAKRAKNRLHLDLRTGDLDAEVTRILGLGASLLTGQPLTEDGWRWHVLADPDGNEFCVLEPPRSRSAPS